MWGDKKVIIVIFLVLIISLTSCDIFEQPDGNETFKNYRDIIVDNSTNNTLDLIIVDEPEEVVQYVPVSDKDIMIGAFNVQIFGKSKAGNEPVMEALEDIIEDYDLLAFQEIRDKSGEAFTQLMQENLPNHDYVISDRLGRTTSKEEYAFIYKSDRITLRRSKVYPDNNDWYERPPFSAEFLIGGYPWVFVVVHTKPTDSQEEIRHLEDVVEWANDYYDNNDIIIMGDLNSDNPYYSEGLYLNDYEWLITDDMDTNVGSGDKTYDRIITVLDYGERFYDCGVDTYQDDGDELINVELRKAVSDHYSVRCFLDV